MPTTHSLHLPPASPREQLQHTALAGITLLATGLLVLHRLRRWSRRAPGRFRDFLNNLDALKGPLLVLALLAAGIAVIVGLLSHAALGELLLFAGLAALGALLFISLFALLFAAVGGDR
jgi:hypothetical protein